MSHGLGRASRKILYKLYGGSSFGQTLEEIHGAVKRVKSNFYVLQRLMEKGLVYINERKRYYLTEEGHKVAQKIADETESFIWDMMGVHLGGGTREQIAKRVAKYLEDLNKKRLKLEVLGPEPEPVHEPVPPLEYPPDKGIVLIDFFAEWCEPCNTQGLIIDELKGNLENNVKFMEVDVEKYKELASIYKVQLLPTVIILKNGVVFKRHVGLTMSKILKAELNSALKKISKCKDGACPLPV